MYAADYCTIVRYSRSADDSIQHSDPACNCARRKNSKSRRWTASASIRYLRVSRPYLGIQFSLTIRRILHVERV